MRQRILTAIVLLAVFIPVLCLSDTLVFVVAISICCIVGTYEMLCCTGQIKHKLLAIPALIYSMLGPALSRTRFATSYGIFWGITLCFLFYLVFVHVFAPDNTNTRNISVVFTTSLYISIGFTAIIRVRDISNFGEYVYLLIFIGAWMTDIFAYFGGRLFGKHKLCPCVSPKKTIEGAVCGIIFCALGFVGYSYFMSLITEARPNYFMVAGIGAFISIISQLGDLAASAIKRDYNVKDYGKIFPGHGGILDRFDSILAVSPFVFMLIGNPSFINAFRQAL